MTQKAYKLYISVQHRDTTLREEEIYFASESQALKTLDRFREKYEGKCWRLDWGITIVNIYTNANDYTDI